MTDGTKDTAAAQPPVDTVVAVAGDDAGIQAVAGIQVQGNQALLVAQFADMDSAKNAYYALVDAESKRAIDIQGVLVANADYQGKIHVQKMTDHTTRTGLKWGLIGGAIIGLIFPPTIIAGAVGVGIAGAAVGKAGNVRQEECRRRRPGHRHRARHVGYRGTRGPHGRRRGQADHPRRQGREVGTRRRRHRGRGQAGRQGLWGRIRGLTETQTTRSAEPGPGSPGSASS